MGWDAYSEPFETNWGLDNPEEGDRAWDECVKELRATGVRTIDGLLCHGGLDCSVCGTMLSRATGESVYLAPWSSEKVQELAKTANWDFEITPDDEWARASAKAFLEHCAKLGRGIKFSW